MPRPRLPDSPRIAGHCSAAPGDPRGLPGLATEGRIDAVSRRGELRIHLGAAPGVGKTFAMLGEARRRAERGADVVVGLVETHGRDRTAELLTGLEIVPRKRIAHRGHDF